MKLHHKIMLNVSLLMVSVIAILSIVVYGQFNASLTTQMEFAAMDLAKSFAAMPQIQNALGEHQSPEDIQTIVEPIRQETRYQYIIVMDMQGKQYSYPYTSGLGKPYKNGGEERVLSLGEAYLLADTNRLISAIRAFVPVKYQGDQVGAVLVGLLTDQVKVESEIHQRSMEIALILSVCIGILMAYFLSLNIKKSIFGLEPKEIALLLSERELILQSLERGIIAVDHEGHILVCNTKAKHLLGLPSDITNHLLMDYAPELAQRLAMAIDQNQGSENEMFALRSSDTVLISLCIMRSPNQLPTGVVVSLEDLTQVKEFAEEITDYRTLVDALRAQNHEFMNKLHVLSGLLQLGHTNEAIDFVDTLSHQGSHLEHLLTEHIRDHKLAGLLLSKYNQYAEKRVQLLIKEETYLASVPKPLTSEDLCSIVGNLIDNAFESLRPTQIVNKTITVKLIAQDHHLEIEVYNNGPEIEEDIADRLFMKGFTTKADGNGIGLHLVKQLIDAANGTIRWTNQEGVTWHVDIPFTESHHR